MAMAFQGNWRMRLRGDSRGAREDANFALAELLKEKITNLAGKICDEDHTPDLAGLPYSGEGFFNGWRTLPAPPVAIVAER